MKNLLSATAISLAATLCLTLPAQAALVTQTVQFESIQPFGSFTPATFTADGWGTPFPVGNLADVQRFYFVFSSADADYLDLQGPDGGVPSVEIGYLDDAAQRTAMVYTNHFLGGTLEIGDENPGYFADLKALLADGSLTVSLGGFENHMVVPGDLNSGSAFTSNYTFGSSSLTLYFETSAVPPGPGDDNGGGASTVPEPASFALCLSALGLLSLRRRRAGA